MTREQVIKRWPDAPADMIDKLMLISDEPITDKDIIATHRMSKKLIESHIKNICKIIESLPDKDIVEKINKEISEIRSFY